MKTLLSHLITLRAEPYLGFATSLGEEGWRVYSHDGPIRRRKRGYIPTMDQSDAGSVSIYYLPRYIFTYITNRTQTAR
eukprot:5540440-Pyramimonas_sp.AAC.1